MKKMNTNMFRTLALALMMMLGTAAAFAQMTVQGEVIDASNGEPIIGASIFEIGTTNGTVTDFDGQFVLKVHNGAKLAISYMGYKKQELAAQPVMKVQPPRGCRDAGRGRCSRLWCC